MIHPSRSTLRGKEPPWLGGGRKSLGRQRTTIMNHRAIIVPDSEAARGGIPLDLAPLLMPYRQHKRLSIRLVHLPARAELTSGVRNEDASWSLAPADLDGLALLLPDDSEPPPSVAVRIIVIDKNENASIVGQFEVPLPRSESPATTQGDTESAQALDADWQRRMDRRAAAAQRLARRKMTLALAQAEAEWQAESEARLSDLARQCELDWQQRVIAERTARETAETRAADAAQHAAALSEKFEAGVAAAVAQAVRTAEAAAEARLAEARAEWRREAEGDIAAARQQSVEAQAAAQRLEASLAATEAQWQMESETRLAKQEQVLELAWRQKLENTRSARDAAEAKAEEALLKAAVLAGELEAARARLAAAEAAAVQQDGDVQEDAEQADAQVAREVEARLATARCEWRKESETGIADAVEQAVRRVEALAEARLRQAREGWERETQNALAVAEGKWRAEAAKRLVTAQAEWRRNSEAGAAAGRRTLRRVARRQGRSQLWRRAGQVCVAAGCVVAAVFLYAEFKPVLWQWAPKVFALASELSASALAELRSLGADLLGRL